MKASILAIVALALIIGGAATWYFLKEKPKASCTEMNPQPTITAFGDSLVAGYGATTKGGFVTLLTSSLGVPIKNLGKNGATTADAKLRVDEVLATKPDVVILLLGGNDALRKVSPDTTRANLDEIITQLQQGGAKVVLFGVLGGLPWNDPYSDMFSELAKTHDLAYIPNVLSGIIGHQDLMSDAVHPNEAGYMKIAERVAPMLNVVCGDLQSE